MSRFDVGVVRSCQGQRCISAHFTAFSGIGRRTEKGALVPFPPPASSSWHNTFIFAVAFVSVATRFPDLVAHEVLNVLFSNGS